MKLLFNSKYQLFSKRKFRIVALLTCRNESLYLGRCLQHLYEQGIETCFIDNESTDDSLEIARSFKKKGVFRIEKQPYNGYFDLVEQLKLKEILASDIDADWFIHHDVDEIREAPIQFKNLYQGILEADKKGYNAINFDEFVFLPTSDEMSFEGEDYVKKMRNYYYFAPIENRRINAWKKLNIKIDLISHGGHRINFEGIKIYPDNFILRHYIVLSRDHAIRKYYTDRVFSQDEIKDRGWHGARITFTPDKLKFPTTGMLKVVQKGFWDTSDVWTKHTFMEGDKS
jgi:glycosyltransferase involved in cell wall biosynthesis